MPISTRRVSDPKESLVCSVEKTKMAGERGLNRDFGGFAVADFADHYDVGILAQDRSQTAREGQTRSSD